MVSSTNTQVAIDKLQHAAADQRARFDQQLAQAKLDARAELDSQLAKAALDSAEQKAQFDCLMAEATLDARRMTVRSPSLMHALTHAVMGRVYACLIDPVEDYPWSHQSDMK